MSIADEVLRLQQAKTDLATSITNKGVTVPSSATLDDYPALVDSISGGGGTNIYDDIRDYMYSIVPSSNPYNDNSAALYNFEVGKTYRIIVKCKYTSSQTIGIYCYQRNANSPAVSIGSITAGDTMAEFTYTHSANTTYTRIGTWVSNSSDRTSKYALVVYIKQI